MYYEKNLFTEASNRKRSRVKIKIYLTTSLQDYFQY